MSEQQVVFTPHGFTSRTSRPEVALATSDVANGAVFVFHCGQRRSLSHVHQGVLGLGQFGLGKVDERRKAALKSHLIEEARWTVTGTGSASSGSDSNLQKSDAAAIAAIKSHAAYGQLSIHVYFDKLLDESNGKAWTIMVRALERDFAPAAAKKAGSKKVHTYTAPAKVPKAPQAAHWLVFDGASAPSRDGEVGRLVAADPASRPDVEPYYSLACYVDVASLVAMAREGAAQQQQGKLVQQQLRLYEDGWLRDNLQRHLNITELSQAGEQIAHSPNGDELFEEIHGRESLLSHLAHWDGFEKDAIYSQGHQCDHDHGDGEDHHHDHSHGHGHVHGQQPTRMPKQMVLWSWLNADKAQQQQGGQGGEAAKAKKKRKKRNKNKSKAAAPTDASPSEQATTEQETQQ